MELNKKKMKKKGLGKGLNAIFAEKNNSHGSDALILFLAENRK